MLIYFVGTHTPGTKGIRRFEAERLRLGGIDSVIYNVNPLIGTNWTKVFTPRLKHGSADLYLDKTYSTPPQRRL